MKTVLRSAAILLTLAGIGLIATWLVSRAGPGRLDWSAEPPVVRKTLMSFASKVYANPEVADGRYYLSKVVLKNSGGQPVRDITVSYQVPEYIPWTTPEVTKALAPGATLVKLFYPKFTDKLSRLANKSTTTLEIRLQWRESEDGPVKEEILRDNFTLLGVNEVQYSDLPASEIATWYDNWTLAQFIVCMVTPNDPVVKEYAAAITERTGGSMAGVTRTPKDVVELMKGTYDYMISTGLRYAGAKGVPEKIGDESKLVQTVRLPRDVITSNNGLCIELAILWASILDHLGCESYIVLRPGHAFTIVVADGQSFPIECTAITPKAVGAETYVPFEKAVEMAAKDLQQQQFKILYNVRQYQADGFASPELPDIDLEKIKNILAARTRPTQETAVAQAGPTPPPTQDTATAPTEFDPGTQMNTGMARFNHPSGLVSFAYPPTWMMQQPSPALGNTFAVGDPATQSSIQVYEIPGATAPNAAVSMLAQALGNYGMQVSIQSTRQQGPVMIVEGTTVGGGGYVLWMGAFRAVQGGVIGVTLGAPGPLYPSQRPMLSQLLNSVQFPK